LAGRKFRIVKIFQKTLRQLKQRLFASEKITQKKAKIFMTNFLAKNFG